MSGVCAATASKTGLKLTQWGQPGLQKSTMAFGAASTCPKPESEISCAPAPSDLRSTRGTCPSHVPPLRSIMMDSLPASVIFEQGTHDREEDEGVDPRRQDVVPRRGIRHALGGDPPAAVVVDLEAHLVLRVVIGGEGDRERAAHLVVDEVP